MQRQPSKAGRDGFSLIEALVALAIASMTLMAIFELQVQMARGQARAQRAVEQVASQDNALALVRDINFSEQPQGQIAMPGGDQVQWTSEPLTPPEINVGYGSRTGIFEVTLHQVTVQIIRKGEASPSPLHFERLGWRRLSMGAITEMTAD